MLRISRRAAAIDECLDAVRLTQDRARLHEAPAAELVSAVAVCAKTLVRVSEATGRLEQRSSVFHVIDRARRLLRRELQRREPHKGH
jgi:Fe-S cluster assembly scaffold protein SufB